MLTTRFASLRILEVDDDFDVADSCALLLKCLGADVRVAYDGETALAVVPEFKPHLALIDIGMPRMDGCETARRLRALPEGKALVLAALTAWSHAEVRHRIREAGFDHHLVKPLTMEALEQILINCSLAAIGSRYRRHPPGRRSGFGLVCGFGGVARRALKYSSALMWFSSIAKRAQRASVKRRQSRQLGDSVVPSTYRPVSRLRV